MSAYGKTQRHWRYIAKVDQNQSQAQRTIKNQRLEKFTPSKLSGTSQENSFTKSPATNNLCKEGRFNSPRGTQLQPKQNLTLVRNSSEGQQLLTFVMNAGSLQKKNSSILDNLRVSNNSGQQSWGCLLEEIRMNYEQFKNEVMQELKKYQEYIHKQMAKVFEALKNVAEMTKQSEKEIGQTKNELINCKITMESNQCLKNYQTLRMSKSADILRFIPGKAQAKTKAKQIQSRFNEEMSSKIELIESKQTTNFDKFFQIMQKLRDTIDGSTSKQPNILKENNSCNT